MTQDRNQALIEKLESDSLDFVMECVGSSRERNKGKEAMRQWFLARLRQHFTEGGASGDSSPASADEEILLREIHDAIYSIMKRMSNCPYNPEIATQNVLQAIRPYLRAPERESTQVWQPIETAPRDGTRILGAEGINVEVIYNAKGSGWFNQSTEYSFWKVFPPTHWMPLPATPIQESPKS